MEADVRARTDRDLSARGVVLPDRSDGQLRGPTSPPTRPRSASRRWTNRSTRIATCSKPRSACTPISPIVSRAALELLALDPKANLGKILDDEAASQGNPRGLAVLREDGSVVAEASRPLDLKEQPRFRDKVVDQPLGTTGATLRLTFAVPATLQDEYQDLWPTIDKARMVTQIRTALPGQLSHRVHRDDGARRSPPASAMFMATLITRRIEALVHTARRVSDRATSTRASSCAARMRWRCSATRSTSMLDDLEQTRGQIEYLQRHRRVAGRRRAGSRTRSRTRSRRSSSPSSKRSRSIKGDDTRFAEDAQGDRRDRRRRDLNGCAAWSTRSARLGQLPEGREGPTRARRRDRGASASIRTFATKLRAPRAHLRRR